ncbi:MAG: hypothetical protein ACYCT7_03090 [bacterium]|jgi:hypothetical protein
MPGLSDLLKNKDKREKPKEYVKEVENINSYTDPKTVEERNNAINNFIKKVVIKNAE